MKNTRMLCISSLMAALCVVVLSLGSIVESLDFSLSILAGLLILILATEYGDRIALFVFLVAGILSLLLPLKTPSIFFLAFFGWYPVVQKKIQMLKPFFAGIVKFLLFNAVMALLLWLLSYVTGVVDTPLLYGATILLANICFVLYDRLLDRFLIWYIVKLRRRFRF